MYRIDMDYFPFALEVDNMLLIQFACGFAVFKFKVINAMGKKPAINIHDMCDVVHSYRFD